MVRICFLRCLYVSCKKKRKKQKSLKGTSVAFNVKEKTKIPGNFCPETNSIIGEHVNIQFGSFKSSRHFWDVNTPIFTHEKCQKNHCVLLLLPKTTIKYFEAYFLS